MEYIGNLLYDRKLLEGIPVVVYGAGRTGKMIMDFLNNNDCKKSIRCFCDKNPKLWGNMLDGIFILSPMEAVRKNGDAHFLIGGNYADEMLEELTSLGVSKVHLLLIY